MLIAFLGFTTACLFFIKFGALTWRNYRGISGILLGIMLLVILLRVIVSRSGK
jgi:hypothetical protein